MIWKRYHNNRFIVEQTSLLNKQIKLEHIVLALDAFTHTHTLSTATRLFLWRNLHVYFDFDNTPRIRSIEIINYQYQQHHGVWYVINRMVFHWKWVIFRIFAQWTFNQHWWKDYRNLWNKFIQIISTYHIQVFRLRLAYCYVPLSKRKQTTFDLNTSTLRINTILTLKRLLIDIRKLINRLFVEHLSYAFPYCCGL